MLWPQLLYILYHCPSWVGGGFRGPFLFSTCAELLKGWEIKWGVPFKHKNYCKGKGTLTALAQATILGRNVTIFNFLASNLWRISEVQMLIDVQWLFFCIGVTISCCLPTYWELLGAEQCVQCERLSGVGCQLHELWGTKHPLCVWGFRPVTQGALCLCVCPGDRLWGELCYTAQRNTFPLEYAGPSTTRKWVENMLATKLHHTYFLSHSMNKNSPCCHLDSM